MFAIIKVAGRQYRVSAGDKVEVDRLHETEGSNLSIEDVLLVSNGDQVEIGDPRVDYRVNLEIVQHKRRPKVTVVHFKRRGGMRRTKGHRQQYTLVKVTSIEKGN